MNGVELKLWHRYVLHLNGEQEMNDAMSEHCKEGSWVHRMGEFVRERDHQGEARWGTDEDTEAVYAAIHKRVSHVIVRK